MPLIGTHFIALITGKTDENLATCSLCGEIQYCKGDSTSAIWPIFIDGQYTVHVWYHRHILDVSYEKKNNFVVKYWVIRYVLVTSPSSFPHLFKN